jgi:hypothetical protein
MNDTESNLFPNRIFLIFDVSEQPPDFYQLLQENNCSAFDNNYGTKTLLKCENVLPPFTDDFTSKEGPYAYDEIVVILDTVEWIKNGNI